MNKCIEVDISGFADRAALKIEVKEDLIKIYFIIVQLIADQAG